MENYHLELERAMKKLDNCHTALKHAFRHWLMRAMVTFPQFEFRVTSGRRTRKEQQKLYAIGRTKPPLGRVVTYADGVKVRSTHQAGLAVDIALIRRSTGQAEWDWRVFEDVYLKVPPDKCDLKRLPFEQPHLEFAEAELMMRNPTLYKIVYS